MKLEVSHCVVNRAFYRAAVLETHHTVLSVPMLFPSASPTS